jgi:hypothetical protein
MILDIEKLPVRELVWKSKNTRFYADTLLFHYTVLPYDEKGQYEWRAFDGETEECHVVSCIETAKTECSVHWATNAQKYLRDILEEPAV